MPDAIVKGECQECGRRFRLRASGNIRHHTDQRQRSNLPFKPPCDGADSPPKPGSVAEEGTDG